MKTNISFLTLFVLVLSCHLLYAQNKIGKDLDYDGVKDSVFYNKTNGVLTVKLSTLHFEVIHSKPISKHIIKWSDGQSLKETKNGFCIEIEYLGANMMTRNNHCFVYEKESGKIRLIKMTSTRGGSGNSVDAEVNLLTNNFGAEWVLYSRYNQTREKLPMVKTKMDFQKIYLQAYNGSAFKKFEDEISTSFEKANEKD